MSWFEQPTVSVVGIAAVLTLLVSLIAWARRCRHPNPHYVRAAAEPAHYVCYECGRHWPAEQRDPAWKPTHLLQKFRGYDEIQAVRAAKYAALSEEHRRHLAAHRAIERRKTA